MKVATASSADASPNSRPSIPARHLQWFIAAHAVVTSVASFLLVRRGAIDEPYVVFRASDALAQIGLGCVLIALWLYLIGAVLYGVVTARLSSWWLLLLPWAAVVLFYLRVCPQGFVEDIVNLAPRP